MDSRGGAPGSGPGRLRFSGRGAGRLHPWSRGLTPDRPPGAGVDATPATSSLRRKDLRGSGAHLESWGRRRRLAGRPLSPWSRRRPPADPQSGNPAVESGRALGRKDLRRPWSRPPTPPSADRGVVRQLPRGRPPGTGDGTWPARDLAEKPRGSAALQTGDELGSGRNVWVPGQDITGRGGVSGRPDCPPTPAGGDGVRPAERPVSGPPDAPVDSPWRRSHICGPQRGLGRARGRGTPVESPERLSARPRAPGAHLRPPSPRPISRGHLRSPFRGPIAAPHSPWRRRSRGDGGRLETRPPWRPVETPYRARSSRAPSESQRRSGARRSSSSWRPPSSTGVQLSGPPRDHWRSVMETWSRSSAKVTT